MRQGLITIASSLHKEWRLLARDWHALLVLFIMPATFVLIMSLALQTNLDQHASAQLDAYLLQADTSDEAKRFRRELLEHQSLAVQPVNEPPTLTGYEFSIRITEAFSDALAGRTGAPGVELRFAPDAGERERLLAKAAVQEAFALFNTTLTAEELGFDRTYARKELLKEGFIRATADSKAPLRPNAVQQSVPAWLVFAMYFIAIPLSTTMIQERKQRTLIRLRTLGVPVSIIFVAKLIPYLLINLLQLVTMLAVGAWLLPLLGGQALSLEVSLPSLALATFGVSLSALGLASFIATLAGSIEQATVASGACNILFAALGGIMIPVFIMPPLMQQLSQLSPMAWGLQAYLEVLLRGGDWLSVLPAAAGLSALGAGLFIVSILVFQRGTRHD